jgi:AcrR family transcriptional regulator
MFLARSLPITSERDTPSVAAAKVSVEKRPRRSQAERRAATRTALLDAAIACLVEEGYANATTRRIAERAGVTPGALQHHFASKTELLGETARHIRAKWAGEMFAQRLPRSRSLRRRHELLLDRMWSLYRGPLFEALLELTVAARTDRELRKHVVRAEYSLGRWIETGAVILYPEFADRSELIELIVTGQAAMRGLALTGLAGEADVDKVWPTTRNHILAMNAQVLGDPDLSP